MEVMLLNYKDDFKMLNKDIIYFDNSATTFKPNSVIKEVDNYYENYSVNASRGDYDLSLLVDDKILNIRKKVAKFINAKSPNEIVFTSGATMSLNMIIEGFFKSYLKSGDEVLTTKSEHASLILPLFNISNKNGATISYIDLEDDFSVSLKKVKEKINKNTKLIAISHVTNVIGDVRPIKEICNLAHKLGILVLIDASQSAPHQKIDVTDIDCDFLVFSAHKMLGPTGIGVLYGKEKYLSKVNPIIIGGGMNAFFDSNKNVLYKEVPQKLEAGTQNIAGIMGFGAAIDYINKVGIKNIHEHEISLKKYAIKKLSEIKNIIIYNKDIENGIITFNIDNVPIKDVSSYLNKNHICIRVGSHCAKILSEVLGVNKTLRASFYFYNTKEEVDKFVDVLKVFNLS